MIDEKEEENSGIDSILESSGILEDGPPLPPHPSMMKKQTSILSEQHHEMSNE